MTSRAWPGKVRVRARPLAPYPEAMALLLLIRHAVTAQTGKRLYGRTPGIPLSEEGRRQAEILAERLAPVPLAAIYTSPMERCRETASALARGRGLRPQTVRDLNEVDYGDWTGRSFPQLRRSKRWAEVRSSPSTVTFPGGESLAGAQRRSVAALDDLAARHPRATIAAIAHGDVIRLALTHYAGVHLDLFQRVEVAPASLSAVALAPGSIRIVRVNDTGDLAGLVGG